ncbi:probable formate dehydrogenase [Melanopsichium pennsylvanicum]|uniref:Formate dehydrogenase n=2 Tax=Melanopsichium pennsylvanicum TaxID=63383 RepID=A0AAJ4XM06_9BASI|nr:probable formate dehydrogenase [Melanopsichium pennsylvanicum 4]SNX84742.1 probable formate dehydrogenase [Melanopsichium pennsylvanicum]
MVKIVAVLYTAGKYGDEQPKLLGTVENKLGIADWLKEQGHELIVTADKDGPNSEFRKHIRDAEIVITTPFHPAYLTAEVLEEAKNLKCCVTAGVGSDHVDLDVANKKNISVYEVTGSNVVSVAEHAVMTILVLVRNFVPANRQYLEGDWNVAEVARQSYDLEGKVVGTLGSGRIGSRILQRLKPFDCGKLTYYDYQRNEQLEKDTGAVRREDLKEFLSELDVLTINCPLYEGTKGLIDAEKLSWMKKGAWIVNTARGAIVNAEDIKSALESGQLLGYGGDVTNQQPPPKDHPWFNASANHGIPYKHGKAGLAMTPHISGTSLDAQKRYADGVKEILTNYFAGKPQESVNVIVEGGQYATKAYGQRK